ncbi:MAG: replication factor C large subunit [Candidatus Woesearchaeota archaeon]
MLWTDKYKPKNLSEIQGQDAAISQLKHYVEKFKPGKAIILHGPAGSGKTASVYGLANELKWDVIEINASDFRNKENVEKIAGRAAKQQSLFTKGKIILVDEVDGIATNQDKGGISALQEIVSQSTFPIVITANDIYESKFSTLRQRSYLIQFSRLNYLSISHILSSIAKQEKMKISDDEIKMIARKVGGDARAAILDLQLLSSSEGKITKEEIESISQREQEESIFNALMKVFKSKDPQIVREAFDNIRENQDTVFLWLDKNLPEEYSGKDLAKAYDVISRADVFRGRIRRWQHWRFIVYINDLITAGVALSKEEKNKHFVKYSPPTRILKLWQANMKYQKRNELAKKLSPILHASPKEITQSTIPYLQYIFKKNKKMAEKIAEELKLSGEEVLWLKK